MATRTNEVDAETIRRHAQPLVGGDNDYDWLMNSIENARFVLLGEASHGTHDFYAARAAITQQLIVEKGFHGVIAEADWPDAYRVNRYVKGANDDRDADGALAGFKRFPQWMWRNRDVLDFVQWLRLHNDAVPAGTPKAGFYGMDLYSMYTSIQEVLKYLDQVDPEAAQRARYRYACFDRYKEDPQEYGYAASFNLSRTCEDAVVQQLTEMVRRSAEYAKRDGTAAEDEYFYAEQNARLVKNAEEYYRKMFEGRVSSWNLRDQHMVETLEALAKHLDARYGRTKLVVWAHNSHLGDARATDMGDAGEWNVGQLVRERWPGESFNVGFTTHTGSVTASTDWGGEAEFKRVRPSLPGSHERLFHDAGGDAGLDRFLLVLRNEPTVRDLLREQRLERAIGVIYRPQSERMSHYFNARLADQFDAVIHFDITSAVEPLERTAAWVPEAAETYPTGL
jgi:erythromycin esterase-like protein